MGLEKSKADEAIFRVQDSGLFGMIDEFTPADPSENVIGPVDYETRRAVKDEVLRAEQRKEQATILIRQMSIR